MKITSSHYVFWKYRMVQAPKWAKQFEQREPTLIHHLINLSAGIRPDYSLSNGYLVLKHARERGDFKETMRQMARDPVNTRRARYVRRWLWKLYYQTGDSTWGPFNFPSIGVDRPLSNFTVD